jgi:hypothetical protein
VDRLNKEWIERHQGPDDCRCSPTRAERTDRLRGWDLVPLACNRGIQRGDRGLLVGGSADPKLWAPSRNCDRRCVLDRQPNGVLSRLSSTRPFISGTSPQGTKTRSQRRRRLRGTTATKAPVRESKLTPRRSSPCPLGSSRSIVPCKRFAPLRFLVSSGRLQGSTYEPGFLAIPRLSHSSLDLVALKTHESKFASGCNRGKSRGCQAVPLLDELGRSTIGQRREHFPGVRLILQLSGKAS